MTDFFASDPCKQHQNIVHGIERWKVVTHWNMSCSNLGQSKCALFVSLLHMRWVLKAKIEATYVEQSFFYSWNEQQSCDFCWWSFYQVNFLFAVLNQRDWIFQYIDYHSWILASTFIAFIGVKWLSQSSNNRWIIKIKENKEKGAKLFWKRLVA